MITIEIIREVGTVNPVRVINDPDSYSHSITATRGFESATFSTKDTESGLEYWLDSAIGSHVVVKSDFGETVWEGFIDEITITYGGGTSITVGPLTNISNKVDLVYQTVDYSIVWLPSVTRTTGFASNTDSQDRYFIFEEILSSSDTTDTAATKIRDTYLEEMAWPTVSQDITISESGANPAIDISCKGYVFMLDAYYYTDLTVGALDADTKIKNVLLADVNDLFGNNFSGIEENTTQVPQFSEGTETALAIIDTITSYGDASDNRWVFAVYEDRVPVYEKVEATVDYLDYLYDISRGVVTTPEGIKVPLYLVRPGGWTVIKDAISQAAVNTIDFRDDPRASFIETVNFSIPSDISISGGKFGTVQQQIARLGIGGIQ